jgi:hypothetical protein
MLDPSGMYPEGYHRIQLNWSLDFKRRPKRYTRTTERPPRYYLIDRLWLASSVPLTRCVGRTITCV